MTAKMTRNEFNEIRINNRAIPKAHPTRLHLHDGRCKPSTDKADTPYIGLELETFLVTPEGAPNLAEDLIQSPVGGWLLKEDASLHSEGGYELSSVCLPLHKMRGSIQAMIDLIAPYAIKNPSVMLEANNRQYGLHCHVDFTAGSFLLSRFNDNKEAAFTAVAGVAACAADIYKYVSGRAFNRWCYLATTPSPIEDAYVCQRKYRAVAYRGNTIEFRAGQGRADAAHITAYLEFVGALIHFTVEIFSTTNVRDWREILRVPESMDEVRTDFVQYIADNQRMYPVLVSRLLKRRSKRGIQDRKTILHADQLELDLAV